MSEKAVVGQLPALITDDGRTVGRGAILMIGDLAIPFGASSTAFYIAERLARLWNEAEENSPTINCDIPF